MTLIEGYAVISTNEEGFKFFLALFNYEEEANEYIAKFPEENLSVVFTSAEFEDELFEVLEDVDVDFDIELEEFLEEYGFELTQIDFGFALFENVDEDFDIIVNLKDKTFDSSIMPDYIKQGIEELGYTAYNDEEPFGKLGSKDD
ncbi:MAG: hypothetical protein BWX57_00415 [Tenericutes bacterium ADurb.Bin024]|nr:MAG: hypothetical protein BWX57_00415 [Tenericutes bacterium ADurb.Bin024]